jgi:hypothetical protein
MLLQTTLDTVKVATVRDLDAARDTVSATSLEYLAQNGASVSFAIISTEKSIHKRKTNLFLPTRS